MRKSLILISLMVVLVAVPTVLYAQSLSFLGKGGESKFFVTGAWVYSFNTHYSIDGADQLTFAEQTGDWSYDYNSFQVGLGLPIMLGDQGQYGSFLLGGTLAIPVSHNGQEIFTNGGAPPTTLEGRKFSADTYYATLEGIWAYPIYNTWSALGGFRWVYWQTSYSNPFDAVGTNSAADTGDVTVNAYLPIFGIMTSMRGLTVGAVGFPTTIGTVEHKESFNGSTSRIKATGDFDGGYFAEIFMEYGVPAYDLPGLSAALSVYGKVSWLRTTSDVKLSNVGLGLSETYDFALQRNLMFIGAKATFDFDLPSLPTSRILYY
jgi:hypothetical protein